MWKNKIISFSTARKEINRKRTRARDEQEEDPKPKIRGSPKGSAFKTPRRMKVSIPVQTPIDVFRTPNIATNDKDVIMEDPALQPAKKTYTPRKDKAKTDQENKENQAPEKRQPRKSEIQANVDPVGILAKVLQTPVTLQVGEVFGISKEMSHHLQDVIRPRRAIEKPAPAQVQYQEDVEAPKIAASFFTRSRGTLIKLRMECDGTPILALICHFWRVRSQIFFGY